MSLIAVPTVLATAAAPTVAAQRGFLPRVTAVSLSTDRARPGTAIRCDYEFENAGDAPASTELTVFVHLAPAEPIPGARQIGGDFVPVLPTFAWAANTRVPEHGRVLSIPADLPPGQYDLFVGLWEPATDRREALSTEVDAEVRTRLGRVTILSPSEDAAEHPVRWVCAAPTASRSAWHALSAPPTGPSIRIAGGGLQAVLSGSHPRLWSCASAKGVVTNAGPALPARARIRRGSDGRALSVVVPDGSWKVTHAATIARYSASVRCGDAPAAGFDVVFRARTDGLRVSVENVLENSGFDLLDVTLPPLVGARGPAGWLVVPTQSGRLLPLGSAGPGEARVTMDWFNMVLCAAAGTRDAAAVIDTRDWDNDLRAVVAGEPGDRLGFVESRFALRVQAGPKAARIRLASKPEFRVRIVGAAAPGTPVTWVDVAKALRSDVRGRPNPIYRDAMLYKVFCDAPGSTDFTTFREALEIVRTVHRLAPWQKQVAYLVGWQYEGHDTGYPATDRINARLGGLDEFRRCAAEAAKLNAVLSVHDNFDDAYKASPAYDEALLARDDQGDIQKGGIWAGGQSYTLAFGKYAARAGVERVRSTVARLGVRGSYHIDVLSAVPIRRDHNPQSPENTQTSLDGKIAIIREFNRLGLDVTSEGMTAPFVGVIGHSWHLWHRRDTVIPGEECVPFIPFIYHGGPTTWGNGAQTDNYPRDSALWGAGFSSDWTKHTDPHEMARAIYLVNLPWTLLRERKMEDWSRRGSVCRVTYGSNTYVEGDERSADWRVVVDGVTVVENDLVTLRRPAMLVAFAPSARQADVELPKELRGRALRTTNLLTGEARRMPASGASSLRLDLPASEPIAIERDGP